MATPHLTSNQPEGTTSTSSRKLNACSSHLLIIRKITEWTNKIFVITPVEEYFSTAIVYAFASSYNTGWGSGVVSDADAITNQYRSLWSSKTSVGEWNVGMKPLFSYYARGWGPWAIRTKADINQNNGPQIYEFGSSRKLLRFKTHALPVGQLTAFNAYLRFWNPSWCLVLPINGGGTGISLVNCPSISHNRSGVVRYHFDTSAMPPTQIDAENYGEADFPSFANEGKGTPQNNGSVQFGNVYDVWGGHLSTASSKSYFDNQKTAIYMKGKTPSGGKKDTSPYYFDHEITGNALAQLKRCIPYGDVYLTIGAIPTNGLTQSSSIGVQNNATIMLYCSRIEMIFNCSGRKFN